MSEEMQNNTEEQPGSEHYERAVEEMKGHVEALQYSAAMACIAEAVDKAEHRGITEEEKADLEGCLQYLSELKDNRDDWGLVDGQPLTPAKGTPVMWTINGCGSKIYGNTLFLTLIYIPVLPLARYAVTYEGDNTYSFHGKLKLKTWQKVWLWAGLIGLAILLFPIVKAMITGIFLSK
ncbi:hypothetical protein Dip518_000159 [Parelusimicrobium proximum]|uniref:hypothetical protein n=1 Tax=Parelusimicrobium proximum TaxID=3228953 RepID=UPI003D17322B